MNYLNVRALSEVWGLSERRITALCRGGRIPGARKNGKVWLIPEGTEAPLDARTKAFAQKLRTDTAGASTPPRYDRSDPFRQAVSRYEEVFFHSPEYTAFAPYRICPLGAHLDHQLGKITGFAIDKGIHLVYGAKPNGIVEVCSLQFQKGAQWYVASVPGEKQNDWADHLRGATLALGSRFPLRVGLCGVIAGELPIGGLSSSAAVIIVFLSALCRLNGISLSPEEMICIAKEAENRYVGVNCGKLDQSCVVYCRKNQLLYLDTKDDSFERIPRSGKMKDYKIAVFFSGLERSLVSSRYNLRVDECRAAAYSMMAFAGLDYGKIGQTNLRDVPYDVYLSFRDRLPENFAHRADHFFSEYIRVEAGAEAWRRGDLPEFGRLCFESGYSSIHSYETGSSELIRLYEIMQQTDGIYGGRFSGAGFKGCCIALIDPGYEQEILQKVQQAYLATFPALRGRYSAHICNTADGILL